MAYHESVRLPAALALCHDRHSIAMPMSTSERCRTYWAIVISLRPRYTTSVGGARQRAPRTTYRFDGPYLQRGEKKDASFTRRRCSSRWIIYSTEKCLDLSGDRDDSHTNSLSLKPLVFQLLFSQSLLFAHGRIVLTPLRTLVWHLRELHSCHAPR